MSPKALLLLTSLTALLLLVIGIGIPLFKAGYPSHWVATAGITLTFAVGNATLWSALELKRWSWFVFELALGPLIPLAYGVLVAGDLFAYEGLHPFYPQAWDRSHSQMWHLVWLVMSPFPSLLYGLKAPAAAPADV